MRIENWREKFFNAVTTMNNQSFVNAFKVFKSQEDGTDCFSVASTRRKKLVLNFYGSLQLKEDPQTTELFLSEDLKEYAEIVDCKDSGKINNYAEYVLSRFSNFQNDDSKNWKSNLNNFDIKAYLEPLPCSNSINCKNSEQALTDFKNVKQALLHYKEISGLKDREINAVSKENAPSGNYVSGAKDFPENNKSQNEEDVPKNKENLFFRTARDELQIQNAKKFGKSGTSVNQPPVKKSLGTRKSSIYGKFQPPLRSSESKQNENKMEVDEVVDERLKNIDPAMVELIKNEIMDSGSKLTWDDIAGLHLAKSTIQEIVVWPMLRPDIFTGLRRPPKGILLFGPPGTGKTLIGKCIASQSNSTFFSISASSLTSKWVGDGEKMVRTLFAVAKVHQPSVVFIDEIDSLLTQRSDSDHECSRRIKTEFLVQLDGAGTGDEDRILIIGATNRPQELDEAARRRLVKRLYIPLPDEEARKQIIRNLISTERNCLSEAEIQNVAKLTQGYSGADVKNLCQEASLGPIRSIAPTMIQSINPGDVRPLNAKDFESALSRIKSSVSEKDLDIYLAWDKQYGCGSALN